MAMIGGMGGLAKILAMSAVLLAILAWVGVPEGLPVAILCAGASALAYAVRGGGEARPRQRWLVLFACTAFLALVALLDFATGYETSVVCFYLLPILVAAWLLPWPYTAGFTVVAALAWGGNQMITRGSGPGALVVVWNTVVQAAIFALVAAITIRLRRHRRETEALRRAVAEESAARRAAEIKVRQLQRS